MSGLRPASDFPLREYSNKQIVNAGKALRGTVCWDEARRDEIIETFRIAYDWRNSHAYPLRVIRHELMGFVRRGSRSGITAGRMKRMTSIRRKLSRSTNTLIQMQDLGGCRAIVPTMDDVRALVALYREGVSAHSVKEDRSYIEGDRGPKPSGYRTHHIVLAFEGANEAAPFVGRKIELQLRTQLQHVWATAVEAVGLVRGEDLKAGEGDLAWLRLFQLMSAEFAELESCPMVPGTPASAVERRDEIKALDRQLKAGATLSNLNRGFKYSEAFMGRGAQYYLIEYDFDRHLISVRGVGSEGYALEEGAPRSVNTVLVEVDKVDNLRQAYPNYFLDVGTFTANINRVVGGAPRDFPELKPKARGYDLSWVASFQRSRTAKEE